MNFNNNTAIIAISTVAIVAILAAVFLVIYKEQQKTPAEKAAESIGEAIEDVTEAVRTRR